MSKQPVLRSAALFCLLIAAPATAQYHQTNIVSDGSVAATLIDPNLKDPWGISFSTTSPFWISDQASNFQNASTGNSSPVTTLLTVPANGSAPSIPGLIVNIPNQGNAPADPTTNGPTGQVSPGAPGITTIASDFQVVGPNGGATHQASFIFANQDGSISAWAGGSSGTPIANTTATLETTTVVPGASFTGLAIANNPSAAIGGASGVQLYAADQNSGNVDVFNSSFQKIGTFTDPNLPAGFTAFNVQNINGILYVLYANPNKALGGIVDEFSPDGTFLKRLIDDSAATAPHGDLQQAWGIALAPKGFGQFGGDLLVGNNGGDGWINAFNPITGAFVGSLTLNTGQFFHEGNLWALSFGNGGSGGDANTLYFTAGLNAAGSEGLFGSLTAVPEPNSLLLVGLGGTIAVVARLRRRRGPIAPTAGTC
jgi:uncharacterized protein (TIGR03118 family)